MLWETGRASTLPLSSHGFPSPPTAPEPGAANGHSASQFEVAKSVHWIVERDAPGRAPAKKRSNDSDDDDAQAPPANDLYRQRQQKRVK